MTLARTGYFMRIKQGNSALRRSEEENLLLHTLNFSPPLKKLLTTALPALQFGLKIKLRNSDLSKNDYLAYVNFAILDDVTFYFQDSEGSKYDIYKTGDMLPFTDRIVDSRKYLYPLNFSDTTTRELYVRITNKTALQIPFRIVQKDGFEKEKAKNELGYGIFYGFLLIMMAYNFFIFLSLRDVNYLYYILTIFGVL